VNNTAKNILVLVDSLDVNRTSGARANMALVQNLGQSFNLTVLHGSESDVSLGLPETINVQELKWNWQYLLSRTVRLLRRYVGLNLSPFFENKVGFSFTFLSLSYSFQRALNFLDISNFHLVITLSQGESFVPHHAVLKSSRFHEKWLAYIHDPYPMSCYPKSYAFKGPGTDQKKRFLQVICKHASFLSFPSLLLSEWMQKFYRFDTKKVIIIPHQIAHGMEKKSELTVESFFDKKKFIILHAGNLLGQRDPMPLVQAFKELHNENSKFIKRCELLFIGPISPNHAKKIQKSELSNVRFYPSLNFEITLDLQKQASVNVIIEAENEGLSPFLPAKFPHCLMSNKPILYLGPEESEVMRLLGPNYKFNSPFNNINKIKSIINELFKNWKLEKEFSYDSKIIDYLGYEKLKIEIESIICNDL